VHPDFSSETVCNHIRIDEEIGLDQPIMTDISFHDDGLDWVNVYLDEGRLEIRLKRELLVYMVANIRNVTGIDFSAQFEL